MTRMTMARSRERAFARYLAGLTGEDIAAVVVRAGEEERARTSPCAICGGQGDVELRYNTRAHEVTAMCRGCWEGQDLPF